MGSNKTVDSIPPPALFVGTRNLYIDGVVRHRHQTLIQELLLNVLGARTSCLSIHLDTTVNKSFFDIYIRNDILPLYIFGWPNGLTPDFTPQSSLLRTHEVLCQLRRPFWQVALIDPDSRLLLRPEGPNTVHRPFQKRDFPKLAKKYRCSVLLSGGEDLIQSRVSQFLTALLDGNLTSLPADWHFMPPLS